MRHQDFKIGEEFIVVGQRWRCTDIGTRTIAAIKINRADIHGWYNGPPYAVPELVFDENDHPACEQA